MAKIKRQKAYDVAEKARSARAYADSGYSSYETEKTAMNLSRGPKKGIGKLLPRYPNQEEIAAAKMMENTRAAELERSALRAKSAERRGQEAATKARKTKALTGRASGGITKKGGKNVNPVYNTY